MPPEDARLATGGVVSEESPGPEREENTGLLFTTPLKHPLIVLASICIPKCKVPRRLHPYDRAHKSYHKPH